MRLVTAALLAALTTTAASAQIAPPATFDFGANLETMRPHFDVICSSYDVRTLDVAELPIAQISHVQVDCHGFTHAGDERLAEFVFGDDALAFVWVLTGADEDASLNAELTAAHGAPSHDTAMFVAFTQAHVALRRDTPELLYYGEAIAPMYGAWFDQMAAAQ
jgi:hypothetical protein